MYSILINANKLAFLHQEFYCFLNLSTVDYTLSLKSEGVSKVANESTLKPLSVLWKYTL